MKTNEFLSEIDALLKKNGVQDFKCQFNFGVPSAEYSYEKSSGFIGRVVKTQKMRFDSTNKEQKEI